MIQVVGIPESGVKTIMGLAGADAVGNAPGTGRLRYGAAVAFGVWAYHESRSAALGLGAAALGWVAPKTSVLVAGTAILMAMLDKR